MGQVWLAGAYGTLPSHAGSAHSYGEEEQGCTQLRER